MSLLRLSVNYWNDYSLNLKNEYGNENDKNVGGKKQAELRGLDGRSYLKKQQ